MWRAMSLSRIGCDDFERRAATATQKNKKSIKKTNEFQNILNQEIEKEPSQPTKVTMIPNQSNSISYLRLF